ncbi:MAG: Bax inhibitor-1/YccA family protein, partial [Candidatus Poseidoniaceae archaeon]
GGFTLIMESMYPGIAMQAGMGTISVFGVMFMIYRFEIIKPTERFMIGVSSAMGAIFLIYLLSFFLGFAGMQIPFLHSSGPVGILISLIFIGIAALMLIVDFAVIEAGVKNKAPASMEWWGAFGLTITLIWVYIEMVRLISKLRNN